MGQIKKKKKKNSGLMFDTRAVFANGFNKFEASWKRLSIT